MKFIEILDDCIAQEMIPGYAMGLIDKDDTTLLLKGTVDGRANGVNVTTRYDIASLTKLFTTVRILQLCETTSLTLTTRIKTVLPEFEDETITIESCLLHRSGFAPSASKRYTLHDDALKQSILKCEDLINPFNHVMVYSCVNYVILGMVIEALDGNLETSFENHIFSPALMQEAGFNPKAKMQCAPTRTKKGSLQYGIVNDSTAHALNGVAGNAGLFVSLQAMVAFAQALLHGVLLNEATLNMIETVDVESRSLGFNRDHNHLYHTGFTGPLFSIDFKNKTALIVLTNCNIPKSTSNFHATRLDILRAYYMDDSIQKTTISKS